MSSILKAVKLSGSSGFFGKLKHKKLAEEWGEGTGNKEPVCDGITFYVKYLGSTLVEQPNDQQLTADAIKTIISMAKASGKKLQRVAMKITPTGITTVDIVSGEKQMEFSIYRISYCSADAAYERVVAFIATNVNETLECHAFLCSKRKIAEASALTISQAFNIAFELWERAREECAENLKENRENLNENEAHSESPGTGTSTSGFKLNSSAGLECALIDFREGESASDTMKKLGLSLDSNLNDSFSKLAESRNHQILSTNVNSDKFQDISQLVRLQDQDPFMQDQVDDLLLL